MDRAFWIGVGLTVVFGFLGFAVKAMPRWIAWLGVVIGACLITWGVFHPEPPATNSTPPIVATPSNSIGAVTNNEGIVTQNQRGNNSQ